ncbi:hypothetical protein AALB39_03515, partial [Lachnospiraceae bacterium 54-53]
ASSPVPSYSHFIIVSRFSTGLCQHLEVGQALEYGYVTYRATWNDYNGTNIMIGMLAQNYEVKIVVTYTDINYKEDVNDSGL